MKATLLKKINDRTARVGVVGLGYVGLPFAVEKAKVGYQVTGIDMSEPRCAMVNRGENYIGDVADSDLKEIVESKRLSATMDYSGVGDLDVIVIAVPTPLTKNLSPDLQYVESVSRNLAKHLRPGQVISLESTTYPGTTEEVMVPILESSGLKVEKDFYLCHSPERVDPGNERYTTKNTNKVIGGVGPESLEVGLAFYSQTIEHMVPVSTAKAAELVKVFENTYRAVNIALVNELALLCDRMEIDVWEVLDAAFTKPFGIQPFYPGPGVGGHCIPIDPHYLEWKAKEYNFNTHFISLAGEINRKMPEFVADKVLRLIIKQGLAPAKAKILAIGAAYKADLGDCRESPAIEVMKLIEQSGIQVDYHDPYVASFKEFGLNKSSVDLNAETISNYDLVLVLTAHGNIDFGQIADSAKQIFDTRNIMKKHPQYKAKVVLL